MLSLGLLAVGAVLLVRVLHAQPLDPGSNTAVLGWWQIALVSALACMAVFHVEINSEAHTFSLSEVPLVLGLFFASPRDVVIGRLLGELLVLVLIERQSLTKLLFNIGLFVAETAVALSVFRLVSATSDPLSVGAALGALAAVITAALLGAVAVWAVIRLHGAAVSIRQLGTTAAVTGTGNACLAMIASVLLSANPPSLIPLSVIAVIVVMGYRGYNRLAKRFAGLELLHQFMAIISGPQRPDETLRRVQQEACRLLRAHRSILALHVDGADKPWVYHLQQGDEIPAAVGSGASLGTDLPDAVYSMVRDDGGTLLVPRTTSNSTQREILRALGAKDCVAAPLATTGGISGIMVICDRLGDVSTFDEEDARLFTTLAAQAAIALENGRLIDRLQEQVQAREHEATHDALTGLPNRLLFARILSDALAAPAPGPLAVLLMDLDGFKDVNDTLGHQAGDELLCEVGRRLRRVVGDRGCVARLGGDEFAVLLTRIASADSAVAIASEIEQAVRLPVSVSALTLEVRGSIGVAVCPEHGHDPPTLLQRADVAMYSAKRGHVGVALYDPASDDNSQLRLQLVGELRAALLSGQIDVHYQPIARCLDGHVVAAEALARWRHPVLGPVGPDEFVPVAERRGLIHELTFYVLEAALVQIRAWKAQGIDLRVAVNLSPAVLRDVNWPARLLQLLAEYRVSPNSLTLEITETGIMADQEHTSRTLNDLVRAGIEFAIDDFGTGYSSLAYLQQLPVSKIKIDKSFVMSMNEDQAAASIVRSVIDLARSLDLAVVAEGVEDQRTLDRLTGNRCHFMQGYYLSRPIPASELTGWLRDRGRADAEPPVERAER